MIITISLPGIIAAKYWKQLKIHLTNDFPEGCIRPKDTINLLVGVDIKNSASELIQNILKNEKLELRCILRSGDVSEAKTPESD